ACDGPGSSARGTTGAAVGTCPGRRSTSRYEPARSPPTTAAAAATRSRCPLFATRGCDQKGPGYRGGTPPIPPVGRPAAHRRGDLATGHGAILVPPTDGAAKTGLKVDRHNRLWACTADGGGAAVYDARTGALLASYRFTTDPNTFVNDEIITRDAVYFTDSARAFLYVVPLGHDGRLPGQSAVRSLALSGPAA